MGVHVARTSKRDDYETPDWFFRFVHELYNFDVDCAADEHNHKCPDYYSAERSFLDAPIEEFKDKALWLNPPFSQKEAFLAKVLEIRNVAKWVVVIVPNNARETDWWKDYVYLDADELVNISPRLNYLLDKVPTRNVGFSSCLLIYLPRKYGRPGNHPREVYWWDIDSHDDTKRKK